MRNTAMVMWAVVAVLGTAVYVQRGWDGVLLGLTGTGQTLLSVLVLILAAFALSGLIGELVSRDLLDRWLGGGRGLRGLLAAGAAGGLMPGGPYAYYPVAGALLGAGADLGMIVTFLAAKGLWAFSRLPLEVALLGPELAWTRYAVTFVMPPLAGLLARALFGRGQMARDLAARYQGDGAAGGDSR